MKKLKLLGLILKWFGVVLLFTSLIGIFEHPNRINFYESLQDKKEMPANSPVAVELMEDFGVPQQQIVMIERIVLKDFRFGKMGRSIAGKVVAVSTDNRRRTLTDLMEFREWAYSKSKAYDWIAFALILVGITIETVLHKKENATQKIST